MSVDQNKQKLKERQTIRLNILKAMFDQQAKVGQDFDRRFSPCNLSKEWGLDVDEVALATQHLEGKLLVRSTKLANPYETYCVITHYGIAEVERAIEYPNQRTEHFMLSVIQHFHAPVGSVQNGPNAITNVEQRTE